MHRAAELGVSLDTNYEHDEPVDTRTRRRSDELVDPLLERLKRVHGDWNSRLCKKLRYGPRCYLAHSLSSGWNIKPICFPSSDSGSTS